MTQSEKGRILLIALMAIVFIALMATVGAVVGWSLGEHVLFGPAWTADCVARVLSVDPEEAAGTSHYVRDLGASAEEMERIWLECR